MKPEENYAIQEFKDKPRRDKVTPEPISLCNPNDRPILTLSSLMRSE
jgi:hypothetical protein